MKRAAVYGAGLSLVGFVLILMAMAAFSAASDAARPDGGQGKTAAGTVQRAQAAQEEQAAQNESETQPEQRERQPEQTLDQACLLRVKDGEQIRTMRMEEYLLGVVGSEMPVSFEPEALKAQAVASRTFALYQTQGQGKHADCDLCASASCCQAWRPASELEAEYGDGWAAAKEKILSAIRQTDGEVLLWQGALIDAVFFSCSAGVTESAQAVWGGEVSYLQPVQSPGEEIAPSYTAEREVSIEDFTEAIRQTAPQAELQGNPSGWFTDVEYTDGNGVARMKIGGVWIDGTELRRLFDLNSTRFAVGVAADAIIFQTMGKGHRVGMSQYGAQAMALEGKTYSDILLHYYTGVSLAQWRP